MTTLRRPRVGHIDFLNCLPLYDGLVRSGALLDVRLRRETPDVLNGLLLAGELDIGPISLVPALQHHRELVVLPDIAVGSDGPVLSVVLVSKRPVEELDGAHISLGSTSRTSVLLAQMLLAQRYDVKTSFETAVPDLGAMLRSADAAVLIGDPALRATYEAPALGLQVLDLGAAWRDWTGLPMVFAVWAARRDYAEEHPSQVAAVQRSFRASLTDSLARRRRGGRAGRALGAVRRRDAGRLLPGAGLPARPPPARRRGRVHPSRCSPWRAARRGCRP